MSSELSEFIAPWIAETTDARVVTWEAKKARRLREREEFKTARDAGLVARYARKLDRVREAVDL